MGSPEKALLKEMNHREKALATISGPIYAGFFRRTLALIIDVAIVLPLLVITWVMTVGSRAEAYALVLVYPAIVLSYHVFFHAKWGQSVGKMITGIKVVQLDETNINLAVSLKRFSVNIILTGLSVFGTLAAIDNVGISEIMSKTWSAALQILNGHEGNILGQSDKMIGLWGWSEVIVMLFNKQRRAFHDFIGGTIVIRLPDKT